MLGVEQRICELYCPLPDTEKAVQETNIFRNKLSNNAIQCGVEIVEKYLVPLSILP